MDRRLLLTLVVGAALVANPLWLLPHADESRHVYRAADATPSDVDAAGAVLVCGTAPSPPCALERRAVTEGVAVGHDPTAFDDRPAFVRVGSGRYYRTRVRWVDGARTATGVPVAFDTVRDAVALDGVEEIEEPAARAVVEEALSSGVSRSRTRVELVAGRPDGPVVVEMPERYVAIRRTGVERPSPTVAAALPVVRGVAALVGLVLVVAEIRRRR